MLRRDLLKMMPVAMATGAAAGPVKQRFTLEKGKKRKMVLIGAGSAMFTQGIVIDWMNQKFSDDWEIALVDINPVILQAT